MKAFEYKGNLIVEHTDCVMAYYYVDENENDDNIVEVQCKSIKEAKTAIDKHLANLKKKC